MVPNVVLHLPGQARTRTSTDAMSLPSTSVAMAPHGVGSRFVSDSRRAAGRWLIAVASLGLAAMVLYQALTTAGMIGGGFETWRPSLYAYLVWAVALGAGQVMIRGEQ